jgi:predicted metal-dependent RNase
MFSYLAFLTFLKETIIKSNKPASINQSRWDSILNDLQNDDKWEKRVFEELTNSSTPIFNIKEDIRQQIKYWKDRRNDCAHFKDNEIDAHHVESF